MNPILKALLSTLLLLCAGLAQGAAPFVVNGDGTVTDTGTGLIWDRCPIGQSGTNCQTGSATTFTWSGALVEAANKSGSNWKGYSDWRLPSLPELQTIVKAGANNPAIDTEAFPGTLDSDFWSSSPSPDYSNEAWFVYFNYGYAYFDYRSNTHSVRLVRGGQYFGAFALTPGGVDAITPTTATLTATSPVAATGYWLVVPRGAVPPTSAQVLAGANYGSVTVARAGNASMAARAAQSFAMTNLTAGTAYDLYLVGHDSNEYDVRSQLVGPIQFATTAIATTSMAIDPTTPTTLYSGLEGAGVYKKTASTDWTASNTGLTNLKVKALAIKDSGILFAGTDGGVFKTTDAGAHWTACATQPGSTSIRSLLRSGTTLYVGTAAGVYVTTNDCDSWTAMNTGLPN